MGEIPTSWRPSWPWSAVLLASLLTACGEPASPEQIQAEVDRELALRRTIEPAPVPVVTELVPAEVIVAAPAPAGETFERQASAPRRRVQVAVSRSAANVVGQDVQIEFERMFPDLDLIVRVVGERDAIDFVQIGEVAFAVHNGSLSARERHAGLRQEPLGVELFGLVVSERAAVAGLSLLQVRRILTGQISEWQQLGLDGGPIAVVVPGDRDVADRGTRLFLGGDTLAPGVIRATGEHGGRDHVLRNEQAIALVRLASGQDRSRTRVLPVDNTPAAAAAFGFGTYPFGARVQVVTTGKGSAESQAFLTFARSEIGQQLLARELTLSQ